MAFAQRETLYGPVLVAAFVSEGLPPEWGLAIARQETAFDPSMLNNTGGDKVRGGSRGICQMSWQTAQGLHFQGTPDALFQPRVCADLAARLCAEIKRRWKTDDLLDIAAGYNSGRRYASAPPGAVLYAKNVVAYAAHYTQSAKLMAAELVRHSATVALKH